MRVVGGQEVHTEVIKLIEDAQDVVVLISPYLDPWPRLVQAVKLATARGVQVIFVVRGGADLEKQSQKLAIFAETKGVSDLSLGRLHAKLYYSKRRAILTSMNLLKSSALDSHEAAVIFDATVDNGGFVGVRSLVKDIIDRAEQEARLAAQERKAAQAAEMRSALLGAVQAAVGLGLKKAATPARQARKPARTKTAKSAPRVPSKAKTRPKAAKGVCIRCKKAVALNIKKPLCATCYATWARFSDKNYAEKHCHSCGKDHKSTVARPVCRPCYSKLVKAGVIRPRAK